MVVEERMAAAIQDGILMPVNEEVLVKFVALTFMSKAGGINVELITKWRQTVKNQLKFILTDQNKA